MLGLELQQCMSPRILSQNGANSLAISQAPFSATQRIWIDDLMVQIVGSHRAVVDSSVQCISQVAQSMDEYHLQLADKSVVISPVHSSAQQIACRLKRRRIQ
eukprot:5673877-Pyramimonas_sp.AAC.1